MRKRPLMFTACVFLTGLAFGRYRVPILVVVMILLVLWELWSGWKAKKLVQTAGRSVILLSAFLLGFLHMQREESFRDAYMSMLEDGSRITVWGELIKKETTEYANRGILSDCYISLGEGVIPCNDIMVYTSKDQFQIGQIYKITGQVNMFSEARNEGNFDSKSYYQSLKVDFAIDEKECVLLADRQTGLKACLAFLKERITMVYDKHLDAKAAGFYQAMVLGNKTNLDDTLKDLFLLGGISHILAISGLHVSILGRGFYKILRRGGVGFGMAGVCGSILLILYGNMVGNSASTVRAVGMMLFFFLSQGLGRSYDMLNALGGMVLFLLWDNPFLIENSGFWFSVTALLGVGIVGRELSCGEEYREKLRRKINFSGLWMSLGITLTTLPVTALSYYEIPLYSPLVNFIVLPLLTPIFCLAIAGGLLGLWFPGLATIILQPCHWLLLLYEWVCSVVARLPCSSVICGKPESWQVALYYGILFTGVYVLHNLNMRQKVDVTRRKIRLSKRYLVLLATICLSGLCIFFPKSKAFEITFLDVGQGDGVYISAGDGTTYFIDGGSSNVDGVGEYRILPFLKAKGVNSIDYWFVSHTDMDHISGLFEVLESGYHVEHLVFSEAFTDDKIYANLLYAMRDAGVETIYMKSGDKICSSNLVITCLGPWLEQGEFIGADKNENSLVLQVEWSTKSDGKSLKALFAGDISTEVEDVLCKKGVLEDVDLFKANHHGSNYSNSALFLDTIRPEVIVVSCAKYNRYGHPGKKAVERMEESGAEIFYTMDGGQVRIELEKMGIYWKMKVGYWLDTD